MSFYQCDICLHTTSRRRILATHMRLHLKQPIRCCVCSKSYAAPSNLLRHIELAHSDQSHPNTVAAAKPKFQCSRCPAAFQSHKSLVKHLSAEQCGDPTLALKCIFCDLSFVNPRTLQAHLLTHSEERQTCGHCSRSFKSVNALLRHRRSHEKIDHECPHCHKRYKTLAHLRQHVDRHSDATPAFVCHLCGGAFRSKLALERHGLTHRTDSSTPPRYKCSICDYRVHWRRVRDEHEETHFGTKPFACELCPSRFTRRGTLREHIQFQHEKKCRFECSVCGRVCISASKLIIHQRAHSGERPHECSECGKRFMQTGDLRRHLQQLHNKTPPKFDCTLCSKSYQEKHKLQLHYKGSHCETIETEIVTFY